MSPGRHGDERRCQGSLRHHAYGKVHKAVGPWDASANPRVRQNRVVPTPEILCVKPSRRCGGQPAAHQSRLRAVTGAIVQRSPRRARHKPSDHRAGKAWYRLPCYAPVHSVCIPFGTGVLMGASRRPAFPAPFVLDGGETDSTTRAKPAARWRRRVCSLPHCEEPLRRSNPGCLRRCISGLLRRFCAKLLRNFVASSSQ